MSIVNLSLLALAALTGHHLDVAPADRATADEAIDRVNSAITVIEKLGEAALDRIAAPESGFVWKDSYVFVVDCDRDVVLVNPAFPERVGGDIKRHADYAGSPYGERLCEVAARPDGGWVDYVWLAPGGTEPRRKISYVRSTADNRFQVGAGIYDSTWTPEPITTSLANRSQPGRD